MPHKQTRRIRSIKKKEELKKNRFKKHVALKTTSIRPTKMTFGDEEIEIVGGVEISYDY